MHEMLRKVKHVSFQHTEFHSFTSRHKFEQVLSFCSINGSVGDRGDAQKKILFLVFFQHLDAHSEPARVFSHAGMFTQNPVVQTKPYETDKFDFLQWVQK